MKKILFLSLIIGGGVLSMFFYHQNQPLKLKAGTGLILTAVPNQDNDYYRPFLPALKSLPKELAKAEKETILTLSEETGSFSYDDIWLRDVAPVVTTRLVKFKYAPNYLPKEDSQYLDKRFRKWLNQQHFDYHVSPLILDGGNCIWDKQETVIITDRVLIDNNSWTKEEIVAQLKHDLRVKNIIIIPAEAGDILAHADGMVKFIGDNTMFISDFLGDDTFKQLVITKIKSVLPELEIVTLRSAYTSKGQYDEQIASAKGLYINMLETDTTMFVPQFGLAADKEQLDFIKSYTDKKVIPIDVAELATMGGALNCLTWYCPPYLLPEV